MSGDFDPRNCDSRDRDDGLHDRDEEWLTLGRGPVSAAASAAEDHVRDRNDDCREAPDRESRDRDDDRGLDPRNVFMRDLDLPRGPERELVRDRDRDYTLSGSETRTLSTVGAFRVVTERDLRDPRDAMFDVRESDLRHLKDEGLIQRVSLDGRDRAVALTDRQSGEAAKWEQELVELQKNLRQLPQNCHKLVKSARQRKSENDVTARKPSHLGA